MIEVLWGCEASEGPIRFRSVTHKNCKLQIMSVGHASPALVEVREPSGQLLGLVRPSSVEAFGDCVAVAVELVPQADP